MNISLHIGILTFWSFLISQIDFYIPKESYFRVYIPPHDRVDVDIRLSMGTAASPGQTIDSGVSNGDEEAMFHKLATGSYFLRINYYRLVGGSGAFPGADECTSYPIELSIAPSPYITTNMETIQPCEDSVVPLFLNKFTRQQLTFSKIPNEPMDLQFEPFTVEDPTTVYIDLVFDFLSSDTSLVLSGIFPDGKKVTYTAAIGANHRVIEELIQAGSYSLSLHDPVDTVVAPPNDVKCVHMELAYEIKVDGDYVPDYLCSNTDAFPTDAYTYSGKNLFFRYSSL